MNVSSELAYMKCCRSNTHPVGEFADHAVPRPVNFTLLAVLAVRNQAYLIVDLEVLLADFLRQVDAVSLVFGVADEARFLKHHEVRRRLLTASDTASRRVTSPVFTSQAAHTSDGPAGRI